MTIPATAAEYFRLKDAERILILEIARRTIPPLTYYLSDDKYETEHGDTPVDMVFSPIIGGSGLPSFTRTLTDPLDGVAATSFGTVTLVDPNCAFNQEEGDLLTNSPIAGDLLDVDGAGTMLAVNASSSGIGAMVLRRGAAVAIKVAAPRRFYPYSQSVLLAMGQIAKLGGDSDGNTTVEITDGTDVIRRATIAVGASSPLSFGRVRNVTAFVYDPATLTYSVHDGQINAVLAVYDTGVLLTPGSGYTVDLVNGRFTLLANPAGPITADVEGAVVGGTWLSSTAQIAGELLRRGGITITQNYGSLPTDVIGIFFDQTQQLGDTLTALMRGCAGHWHVGRDGIFTADVFPVPSVNSGGAVYDSTLILAKVGFVADDRLHEVIHYSYRRNWTVYQSLPGASATQASFSQLAAMDADLNLDSSLVDAEVIYNESTKLETYFDAQAPATSAAQRVLNVFSVQRQRLTTDLSYSDTLDLGTPLVLIVNGIAYSGVVLSVADQFNGEYPVQKVEVLA